jgi:hypothetical protein
MPERNLPDTGQNHRVDSRYPALPGARATCHRAGAPALEGDLALALIDLTDVGAGLLVHEPIGTGEMVEVGILAPGWAQPLTRTGVVCWSGDAVRGYRIGVVFATGLNFAELEELCELPIPAVDACPFTPAGLRRQVRVPSSRLPSILPSCLRGR